MANVIEGTAIVAGEAAGPLLVSSEPLSFWGGYDQNSGQIIDQRHPLYGQHAAGRVLAIPFTIGSSTTTAVLLEAIRAGTAPAALITRKTDSFLALASIVADQMYGKPVPLIALSPEDFLRLKSGESVQVLPNGHILFS